MVLDKKSLIIFLSRSYYLFLFHTAREWLPKYCRLCGPGITGFILVQEIANGHKTCAVFFRQRYPVNNSTPHRAKALPAIRALNNIVRFGIPGFQILFPDKKLTIATKPLLFFLQLHPVDDFTSAHNRSLYHIQHETSHRIVFHRISSPLNEVLDHTSKSIHTPYTTGLVTLTLYRSVV